MSARFHLGRVGPAILIKSRHAGLLRNSLQNFERTPALAGGAMPSQRHLSGAVGKTQCRSPNLL